MKKRNVHPKLKDFLFPRKLSVYNWNYTLAAIQTFTEGRELDARQLLSWLECQEILGRKWVRYDDFSALIDISGLIKHLRVAIQLQWIEEGPIHASD